jgi:hypothetical protein
VIGKSPQPPPCSRSWADRAPLPTFTPFSRKCHAWSMTAVVEVKSPAWMIHALLMPDSNFVPTGCRVWTTAEVN